MLLRKKCENKKETKVCNFKLESEVHQTNKQKKKQPTGFSWVGMSLYQLQGCPHPDLTEGMRKISWKSVTAEETNFMNPVYIMAEEAGLIPD